MASQTVPQIHPNVVPFQAPTEEVRQEKLELIMLLRNERKRIDEQLESVESEVRAALEAKAPVEPGVHIASLKESFRRNVAWREVAERLGDRLYGDGKGEPYCERVLASTKPVRTVTLAVS
jgi:hypothetical protein